MKSTDTKTSSRAASAAMHFTIAIVEDDETMNETLAKWVREMGHTAIAFTTGGTFLKACRHTEFSLFLLDWALPDIEGIDLVRRMRSVDGIEAPIILCTSRDGEADIVEALGAGADDFIVKPIRRHELAARIAAALRRATPQPADGGVLSVPPFSIDLANRVFHIDGKRVELQNREYELALLLFQNLNGVVSRARIIQGLWGSEPMETSRTLDTHISRVRRKLGIAAERGLVLQSVYGLGYRLQAVAATLSKD
ncbi:MAG: response regulator transcription factor [Betaproteobacteria bacterium]|nr:response regulator transcription factor [Betaproteobacteria bacterium]